MSKSFTQRVREAASKLEEFTIDELAAPLCVRTYKDRAKVRRVIKYLKRNNEIGPIRVGLFKYQGKDQPLSKQARIWRAIRIKEYFSRFDVVKLSGASDEYVKRYFTFLKRKGFIAHVSGRGSKNGLYRLIEPEKVPIEHPIFNRRKLRNET
jgi:hypothetical protein